MLLGWIKLHRQLLDNWIMTEPEALSVWIRFLLEANHDTKKKMLNGSLVEIKRGQLVFGLEAFSARSGVSIAKLRRYIKLLENDGMINRLKTAKYSIITIVSFESYQSLDRQTTNKEQSNDKQIATPKECKNDKNVKNKDLVESESQRKKFNFTDVDYQCAEWIYSLVKKVAPSSKKPNFESWANTVRLMRESDKLTHNDISEVFTWANQDSFWSVNILSATKLRQKFPQLQAKMKGVSNGSIKEHGQKLSAHERAKQRNDAKYRRPDECGLVVGANDGHMGGAVDQGKGRVTIEHVDTGTFTDYE